MYVCILDQAGTILVHKNLPATPEAFLRVSAPYREDLVVAVECIFTWSWLADLCAQEGIAFVLGHALYMKAIHGGKAKNDKIDAHKIAVLLRGGMLPMAYGYPAAMRATRDLLRRRCHLMRKRAELLAHLQNTNSQYNLPDFGKKLAYKGTREGVEEHFSEPSVRKTIEMAVALIDHYDKLLGEVERSIPRTAKGHDAQSFSRLQSVPGIGQILALVILYEIQDLTRFPRVQDFVSYCRLVKCAKESAASATGSRARRVATPRSSGPSRKRPCCSYTRISRGRPTLPSWNVSTARAKPSPCWPISWLGQSIIQCCGAASFFKLTDLRQNLWKTPRLLQRRGEQQMRRNDAADGHRSSDSSTTAAGIGRVCQTASRTHERCDARSRPR
jgi:transposase